MHPAQDGTADGHRPKRLLVLLWTEVRRMVVDLLWSLVRRGASLPRATYVHPRARLVGAQFIECADHCQIHAGATLRATPGTRGSAATLRCGRFVIVRENAYLDAHGGSIRLDDGAFVGQGAVIYGQGGVTVGRNTLLSPGVTILTAQHSIEPGSAPIKFQAESFQRVDIGEDCWLGANVVVLAGVTIGDGAVIGAGSVVTRDVPARVVAAGVPVRVLRER